MQKRRAFKNRRARDNRGREKPTISDVAERAKVSIATVSRVVNESDSVAEATRERVQAAIDELQFRPDRTAKSLAQQSTRTLAVALPSFTTPFHNELLKGMRFRLKDADVELLLCDLQWEDPEATLLNFLGQGAMDGLIVAGLQVGPDLAAELNRLNAPVVLIGSEWEQFDSYYWDNTAGARRAVEHLIEQGHEHIGMITPSLESSVRDARVRGYREALQDAGLECRDEWITSGSTEKHAGFSEESGYEAMQELLRSNSSVTAVFASSDVQAIGAWQAIRQEGLEVPDDVALVGYDDIKVSRFIGLTTVAQYMHDIGEQVTDLLLRRLDGSEADPRSRLISPELIVRRTS